MIHRSQAAPRPLPAAPLPAASPPRSRGLIIAAVLLLPAVVLIPAICIGQTLAAVAASSAGGPSSRSQQWPTPQPFPDCAGLQGSLAAPLQRAQHDSTVASLPQLLFVPPGGEILRDSAEEGAATCAAGRAGRLHAEGCADQIWLIDTRGLSSGQFLPRIKQLDQAAETARSSLDAFHAGDAAEYVTVVFVHGNNFSADDAVSYGLEAYASLVDVPRPRPPVRFVIWSWPSDRQFTSFSRDARVKACRTNVEARHMAAFLADDRFQTPISLVGYSFGARVICGALHLSAGGQLCGQRLPESAAAPAVALRAVLLAAAMDNDWLLPGEFHGLALEPVERMTVLINRRDVVLRFYPVLHRHTGSPALGISGLWESGQWATAAEKLVQHDVTDQVRMLHSVLPYLRSAPIMARIRAEALFLDHVDRGQQEVAPPGYPALSR